MCTQTSSHKLSSNDSPLAKQPIDKLFLTLALPMIFGMLLNGLHNLVDTYVVSQFIGSQAMAAVAIAFPIQMCVLAIATMINNGASILMSQALGANNHSEKSLVIFTAIKLSVLISTAIAVGYYIFSSSMLEILRVPKELESQVHQYFFPLMLGNMSIFTVALFCDFFRASGKVDKLFILILVNALTNLVLDLLFVIGFDMGVRGAALATLGSHLLTCLVGLRFIPFNLASQAEIRKKAMTLDFGMAKKIAQFGTPTLLQYSGAAIVIGIVNFLLSNAKPVNASDWLSAYGIICRLNVFVILPLIAMTHAIQTIVSFNHGLGNYTRVKHAVKLGLRVCFLYLTCLWGLLLLLPEPLIGIFSDERTVVELAARVSKMMYFLLPLASISMVASAYLQGINRPTWAIFVTLFKIYILIIPCLYVLELSLGYQQLWYAFPAADLLVVLIVAFVFFRLEHDSTQQWTTAK